MREQYLPQPGNSAETLALKRQNRASALSSMIAASGPAYSKLPTAAISEGTDPLIAQVDDDIKQVGGQYTNREELLVSLVKAYPELTESEIAGRVYTLIPDKK